MSNWWRSPRRARPSADSRHWVHPSELPNFDKLETTTSIRLHAKSPRTVAVVMLLVLVVGGIVLMANRGSTTPNNLPAHLATTVKALPASSRAAAGATVDLTINWPGHVTDVAALILPHDLAVTTTVIPANAIISGSTTTKVNFPVTLEGRDNVMGFSIVKLSVPITALPLDAMPASTAVVAVAPIVKGSTKAPEFDWTMTTLGDPINNAQGVVRYLATESESSLSGYVDAIAVDSKGHVVAILSSRHFWYPATFVAQVADVVATGRGCHADLGISGTNEQGGGVLITKIKPYSAAAHADLKVGDVITNWNGTDLDTWNQLVSTLYLTPAYTAAHVTYDQKTTVLHAVVTLGCPFRLVP